MAHTRGTKTRIGVTKPPVKTTVTIGGAPTGRPGGGLGAPRGGGSAPKKESTSYRPGSPETVVKPTRPGIGAPAGTGATGYAIEDMKGHTHGMMPPKPVRTGVGKTGNKVRPPAPPMRPGGLKKGGAPPAPRGTPMKEK